MKQKKVYLLAAPPATGKSTWVRRHLTPGAEWISRDKVRFAILGDGDDYFAHEDEVFDTFISYINQTLERDDIHTIFIDATHLNKWSRGKVLRRVRKNNIEELNCVCFDVPIEVALERNALRTGRERVPDSAIENMYKSYSFPQENEGFNHVFVVNVNGDTEEVNF
jgi:predicted kinase